MVGFRVLGAGFALVFRFDGTHGWSNGGRWGCDCTGSGLQRDNLTKFEEVGVFSTVVSSGLPVLRPYGCMNLGMGAMFATVDSNVN